MTWQDCERKEERLAKAKVWDQKRAHIKGSCYSFLSSALNDSRRETSIRESGLNTRIRLLMLQEKPYFRHSEKHSTPKCLSRFLPFSICSASHWLRVILVIFKQHHCWGRVLTVHIWLYSTSVWLICCVSCVHFKTPHQYLQLSICKGFHHLLFHINKS